MCTIHWLLGIGDRHLDNTLICKNTGQAIGIDFGLSFDMSTRNSPFPELVPFRLTPHIINLIEPLETTGFIELTMVHCLEALRKENDILLSAMDVFINEPTMCWLETAQFKAEENETTISDDFIPREKIMNAQNKFDGCNPVKITLQELKKRNFGNEEDYLKSLQDIVRGTGQDVRNKLPLDNLSAENQIKCLLNQATDFNILGRTFAGYEAWV